jgi:hypothetical protein
MFESGCFRIVGFSPAIFAVDFDPVYAEITIRRLERFRQTGSY